MALNYMDPFVKDVYDTDFVIDRFSGTYSFLSNFYLTPVYVDGILFPSSENAYQGFKCKDYYERLKFVEMSPSEAKKKGRQVELSKTWDRDRLEIMHRILCNKFDISFNQVNAALLLSTGNAKLIEGNTWNDKYWGVCDGKGKNNLGKLLMLIRRNIRKELDSKEEKRYKYFRDIETIE